MNHLARMMRHFISLVLWPFFLLWCSLASITWYEVSLKQARLSSTRRPRTTLRYFVVITLRPLTRVIRTRRPNRCWEVNVVTHLSTWKLANYLWWLTGKPFYSIELEESSNHSHLLLFLLSKASCTVRRGKFKTQLYFYHQAYNNPSRKRSFSKTLFKSEKFKNAVLRFSVDGKRKRNLVPFLTLKCHPLSQTVMWPTAACVFSPNDKESSGERAWKRGCWKTELL